MGQDDGMRVARKVADLVEKIQALEERKKRVTAEFNADLKLLHEKLGQMAKDIHSGQVDFLDG